MQNRSNAVLAGEGTPPRHFNREVRATKENTKTIVIEFEITPVWQRQVVKRIKMETCCVRFIGRPMDNASSET